MPSDLGIASLNGPMVRQRLLQLSSRARGPILLLFELVRTTVDHFKVQRALLYPSIVSLLLLCQAPEASVQLREFGSTLVAAPGQALADRVHYFPDYLGLEDGFPHASTDGGLYQ